MAADPHYGQLTPPVPQPRDAEREPDIEVVKPLRTDEDRFSDLVEIAVMSPGSVIWALEQATLFPEATREQIDKSKNTPRYRPLKARAFDVALDVVKSGMLHRITPTEEQLQELRKSSKYLDAKSISQEKASDPAALSGFHALQLGFMAVIEARKSTPEEQ